MISEQKESCVVRDECGEVFWLVDKNNLSIRFLSTEQTIIYSKVEASWLNTYSKSSMTLFTNYRCQKWLYLKIYKGMWKKSRNYAIKSRQLGSNQRTVKSFNLHLGIQSQVDDVWEVMGLLSPEQHQKLCRGRIGRTSSHCRALCGFLIHVTRLHGFSTAATIAD